MATYNEIQPNVTSENHNALYMIVGIILALMIAGFAFYYYTGNRSASYTTDNAGTVVERNNVDNTGAANNKPTDNNATQTRTMSLSTDNGNGVTATTTTQKNPTNY